MIGASPFVSAAYANLRRSDNRGPSVFAPALRRFHRWKSWELGPLFDGVESWFERRSDQLPLLFPVGIGSGIAAWQLLGDGPLIPLFLATLGVAALAAALGLHFRFARFTIFAVIAFVSGYSAIAFKSAFVSEPAIAKIWIGQVNGRVRAVEEQSAREIVRITLDTDRLNGLPARIRVNVPIDKYPTSIMPGAIISAKVRLMPPPGPALPGSYDFSRQAWFQGLGATGSVLGDIVLLEKADGNNAFWEGLRSLTARHIQDKMPQGTGAIGAALLVGSRGGISEADNEALRNSGMAHLLSVSGLHVTAVVGAVFILISRMLALFPWLALRIRVPLIAAGGSAIVAVGYTLLTGSEVPTVRACVAALMILAALMLGREALSMRLLAFGAIIVLLLWPESLAGPSFQLSFAAVATIIFLHESSIVRRWTERRDEALPLRLGRVAFSLLLTGLAIEIALAPIALFHFHKSGLYGAFANIMAIPLTTFFIMPLQLAALCADLVGIGAPFWWLAGLGIEWIRWLAHFVSSAPGALVLLPAFPPWAFASIILGAIFAAIVKGRSGAVGILAVVIGAATMAMAQRPDILITGDGRHLAVVDPNGDLIVLRPGAGDYAMSILTENAAFSGEPKAIDTMEGALCSADVCTFPITKNGRSWSVLATRSQYLVPAMEMAAACTRVDIVISDRWLPYSCKPRWLKADRRFFETHGGLALYLETAELRTVSATTAHLPWSQLNIGRSDKLPEPTPQ